MKNRVIIGILVTLTLILLTGILLTGCKENDMYNYSKQTDEFEPLYLDDTQSYNVSDTFYFAGKYAQVMKESDSVTSDIKSYTDIYDWDKLNIKDSIGNKVVEAAVNVTAISNDYTIDDYEYLGDDTLDDNNTAYIVRFNYDYYLIIYYKDIDNATIYHDSTGYLASLYNTNNTEGDKPEVYDENGNYLYDEDITETDSTE